MRMANTKNPSELVAGLILSSLLALVSAASAWALEAAFGRSVIEPLVLAILIGATVRTVWGLPQRCVIGTHFAASRLLEWAVVLMGCTIHVHVLKTMGVGLLAAIVITVVASIITTYVMARWMRVPHGMATLIACGNAICGNSAIAAVAPVIRADHEDVATSAAFTAVLGIAVVMGMPHLAAALHLGPAASGILAGLTVYAVPQVLAAAAPMGPMAVQLGTMVKLMRVLMLGPVVLTLAMLHARRSGDQQPSALTSRSWGNVLPGFIVAFLVLASVSASGGIAPAWADGAQVLSRCLTLIAMAALGLSVNLRHVAAAGPRLSLVVTASLVALTAMAWLAVQFVAT